MLNVRCDSRLRPRALQKERERRDAPQIAVYDANTALIYAAFIQYEGRRKKNIYIVIRTVIRTYARNVFLIIDIVH